MTPARRPTRTAERVRRSQSERAEQMRDRLLDATIDCLIRSGYSELSTNDIVRRARVSRGALAHHYPTKAELVTAAARRLVDERAADFRRRFGAVPPERRTPAEALELLWSFYAAPSGIALVELTVAARHSRQLRAVLAPVAEQVAASTAEVFAEFFPERAGLPFTDQVLRTVHALFAGLALSAMAAPDGDGHTAEVRTFLKHLVSLAETFAPFAQSTVGSPA
ncbi:MAG TPA: TetR/AcrR family transcriptional regulator [Jatrophihabitantaceae bacterium]|nr:TetR/AcrR family transcriptional regulator [Jatrophihabitantaceae bacterium]